MESTIQLIYMGGSLILGYAVIGISKLLKRIIEREPISISFLIFASLTVPVVWQFMFGMSVYLNELNDSLVHLNNLEGMAFSISIIVIMHLSLFFVLIFLIFPLDKETLFTTKNERFRKYLREKRRALYGAILLYIALTWISNHALNVETGGWIDAMRIIMMVIVLIGMIVEFRIEKDKPDFIDIYFRFPFPFFWYGEHGIILDDVKQKWKIKSIQDSNTQILKRKYYNRIDYIIGSILTAGFIMIILSRYYI